MEIEDAIHGELVEFALVEISKVEAFAESISVLNSEARDNFIAWAKQDCNTFLIVLDAIAEFVNTDKINNLDVDKEMRSDMYEAGSYIMNSYKKYWSIN